MIKKPYPDTWVEVFCNDCHGLVGAYDDTRPQPVMGYACICTNNLTWVEPTRRSTQFQPRQIHRPITIPLQASEEVAMSYTHIEHYRFRCDAPGCRVTSPIIAGTNVKDAGRLCERYSWHVVMGNDKPLFTYCPEHYGLWEE